MDISLFLAVKNNNKNRTWKPDSQVFSVVEREKEGERERRKNSDGAQMRFSRLIPNT